MSSNLRSFSADHIFLLLQKENLLWLRWFSKQIGHNISSHIFYVTSFRQVVVTFAQCGEFLCRFEGEQKRVSTQDNCWTDSLGARGGKKNLVSRIFGISSLTLESPSVQLEMPALWKQSLGITVELALSSWGAFPSSLDQSAGKNWFPCVPENNSYQISDADMAVWSKPPAKVILSSFVLICFWFPIKGNLKLGTDQWSLRSQGHF